MALRKVQIADSSDEDDVYDGTESEAEMAPPPKPRKSGLRKSISHADDSFTSETGRPPTNAAQINDDAAEKRRRRKSTKLPQDSAMAGPSRERQEADGARSRTRVTAVQAPDLGLSKAQMNTNFDEWMKMHTDGKINATNSWDVYLIDYFHDMSLLKNGEDDSINFQRASYTLDGCVKIWTSRVDSVGTDSAKLASNLASGRNDVAEESGDDDGLDDSAQPKKKRAHRSGATLKDAAQLRSKKIDTEFLVDPLFKKTCADFDEGGAQGLLMNHLSLGVGKDGGLRVVFDAGDSLSKGDEDDDIDEPQEDVDLSELRHEFLPDLSLINDLSICPELADFSFQKDSSTSMPAFAMIEEPDHLSEEELEPSDDFANDNNDAPPLDYFDVPGGDDDEDIFAGDFSGDHFGGDDDGDEHSSGGVNQTGDASGQHVGFDPRNTTGERTLMVSMDANSGMDLFDNENSRNWAGPEHYKSSKKLHRRDERDISKTTGKKREKKEAVKIDFLAKKEKSLKEIMKSLFEPASVKKSINLPAKKNEKTSDHRLPDDMHFTSRQLVSLFLKPKFSLTMRGQGEPGNATNDEVDEVFWAQAQADKDAEHGNGDDHENAIPTQFFQDDFDDGNGFDDGFDGVGGVPDEHDEQDMLATQGQGRRVKPPTVTYAKRAKRVDVKRLKDNIWKGLEILTSHAKKEDGMDVDEDVTDPSEARDFKNVISSLEKQYPQEKMEEISTSFCFICLLHLANEQGLRLEEGKSATEAERIGKLWDVKVYRDPDAIPAA